MTDTPRQDRRQARVEFAETLAEFNEQRSWYSSKAGRFKQRSQRIDMLIIGCGALITFIPVLKPGAAPHWTMIATSLLGGFVVMLQGFQRIFRYVEIWPEYRLASERMKREWRLFVNGAEAYDCDDADARQRYVLHLEQIIADEQKIFFDKIHSADSMEEKEKSGAQ